ncbi:cell division protein SepF [Natranaerofaba carboxydovora]|uniref:cell division protein SepF n=1 Tax=Natranaerofaba carboxydovora TaxID=2742683 RepID=UPI001F1461D6|nr:cell division protein SepF [Natranaerofaba carboxydovora]UMZ73271.1 Cell division protein SepF [Natranaerofaba carboxydovora]
MNFFEKILVTLGLAEETTEEDEEDNTPAPVEENKSKSSKKSYNKKSVVAFPSKTKGFNIMIMSPTEYEEAQRIGEFLKNAMPVIVNLEKLGLEEGKQLIDFVSGTVFGLDGTVHKIGKQIFLFSPPGVEVMGNIETQVNENDLNSYDG